MIWYSGRNSVWFGVQNVDNAEPPLRASGDGRNSACFGLHQGHGPYGRHGHRLHVDRQHTPEDQHRPERHQPRRHVRGRQRGAIFASRRALREGPGQVPPPDRSQHHRGSAGNHRRQYEGTSALLRAAGWRCVALWRRHRQGGLRMVGPGRHPVQARMADMDAAGRNDRAPAGAGQIRRRTAGRPRQPAGRACALHLQGRAGHALPGPWLAGMGLHRQVHVFRLRTPDQSGHHRSLQSSVERFSDRRVIGPRRASLRAPPGQAVSEDEPT